MFVQKIHFALQKYYSLLRLFLPILAWFFGCTFGVILFQHNQTLFQSLIRCSAQSSVSVFGVLISAIVPICAVYYCINRNCLVPACFIIFVKALSYCVCSASIFYMYGSAGWLAQILLLFTENCSVVLLFTLWLFSLHRTTLQRHQLLAGVSAGVVISAVNIFWISPICVSVFTF